TYTDMGGNTHKLRDHSITLSELIEKAESGKLVELGDTTCQHDQEGYMAKAADEFGVVTCLGCGLQLQWVKPLASGESR
ncbi:hypothetical protein LCGC14_1252290, partial [marine sediment metagenome]